MYRNYNYVFIKSGGGKIMLHKKSLAIFLSSLLIVGNIFSAKTFANAEVVDTTAPILNNINIDKSKVTEGDSVNVSIDASDDISGIAGASIYYVSPSGKNSKSYSLTPDDSGKLICTIPINKYDEKGKWKLDSISLKDKAGNTEYVNGYGILNSNNTVKDLSVGNFEVINKLLDTMPPVLNSITLNKTKIAQGKSLKVTVDASDDLSGIYSASIHYVSPSGKNSKYLVLWPNIDGNLQCTIPTDLGDEDGIWKVDSVLLIDRVGNTVCINNSEVKEYGILKNLSPGDFQIYGRQAAGKQFDINEDNDIDIKDLAAVARDYNTKKSDDLWKPEFDYNNDGIIDIFDITVLFKKVQ